MNKQKNIGFTFQSPAEGDMTRREVEKREWNEKENNYI